MKTQIALFLLVSSISVNAQKVNVPFFEPIENSLLCGTTNCCPSSGDNCDNLKNGYFFTNVRKVLGRMVTGDQTLYESRPFAKPTSNSDIENPWNNEVNGTLKGSKKNEFKLQVSAKFDDLLTEIDLPETAKAKLNAEFTKAVEKNLTSQIKMKVRSEYLDNDFLDANVYNKKVSEETYVISGLTYLSVEGTWTTNVLKETLAKFEASAEYGSLSAEAKGKYNTLKSRTLDGKFSVIAMAFKASYITLYPE